MRRASNVDAAQGDIVSKLRSCGVTVKPLHMVGGGFPDLACGYRGKNILLEIKTPKRATKPATKELQSGFAETWAGQVATVKTWEEAMHVILKEVGEIK